MNDKETQQIQCWIEDNSADVNSSDLFDRVSSSLFLKTSWKHPC